MISNILFGHMDHGRGTGCVNRFAQAQSDDRGACYGCRLSMKSASHSAAARHPPRLRQTSQRLRLQHRVDIAKRDKVARSASSINICDRRIVSCSSDKQFTGIGRDHHEQSLPGRTLQAGIPAEDRDPDCQTCSVECSYTGFSKVTKLLASSKLPASVPLLWLSPTLAI